MLSGWSTRTIGVKHSTQAMADTANTCTTVQHNIPELVPHDLSEFIYDVMAHAQDA